MHARSARSDLARELPWRTPAYWKEVLEEALVVTDLGLANEHLPESRLPDLVEMRELFASMIDRWWAVERVVEAMPPALCHGNLSRRHVRMVSTPEGLRPLVVDWEDATFGPMMIDLIGPDLDIYLETLRDEWRDLAIDRSTLSGLLGIGAVCRSALMLCGEQGAFGSPWPHRAAEKVPAYLARLESPDVKVGLDLVDAR
jgi:hypothetical protein